MKIRNKQNGKIFEIADGALYPKGAYTIVEEKNDDDKIKVGEPKVETEIIETLEETEGEAEAETEKEAETVAEIKAKEPTKSKKTAKKAKKG